MRKRLKVSNRNHRAMVGVIILFLLVGMGIGYSYLTTSLSINGTTVVSKNTWNVHFENLKIDSNSVTASSPAIIDSTTTGVSFSASLNEGDIYSFTVDIVNSGSIDAMVSALTKTNLTEAQTKYLEYIITYSDGSSIIEKELLPAGASKKVKVIVRYKEDVSSENLPTAVGSLKLSFNISYVQADESATASKSLFAIMRSKSAPDNVSSEYVTASTGIDFSKISSDTNGKGVYMLSSTKDNINPIYYYRGEVDNNNVKFANFCWKIVRTTETGGIKLIYNGIPNENGYCNNLNESATIGKSEYNFNGNDNAYVGYMYGTVGSTSYEETHRNTNNSEIKKKIDDWYSKNMTDYTDKLEDTVWCNDRGVVNNDEYTGNGTGTSKTMYKARNRLYINKIPSLECTNINDRFTVDSANGNGTLTYPVALLTADEIAYAGGVYPVDNNKYYLYTNSWYWTLSSYAFNNYANWFNIGFNGTLRSLNNSYTEYQSGGVRPSISLKPGTKISAGNGSVDSPYVVE